VSSHVHPIVAHVREAEQELTTEWREQQRRWRYRIHRGRVWFDAEVREAHEQLREALPLYVLRGSLLNLLTAPMIYALIVPLALLDACVTLYQWACFPIYGVGRVRRRPYFVLDRHKLGYLNALEKANCVYCSYATGVIGYVREVAARTEHYWCPIKHARPIAQPHSRYRHFLDYGDAAGYRRHHGGLQRHRRPARLRHR
jgi:hypothetical protein